MPRGLAHITRAVLCTMACLWMGPAFAVVNGNFESGATAWTQSAPTIITNDAAAAHAGSWYAWLGRYDSASNHIYQDVVIPANVQSARVQFWYQITTEETAAATVYDRMLVSLESPTSGATLSTLGTFTNLTPTSGWVQSASFDVSAFKGQTVRVRFGATTDSSLITSFRVDDVTLSLVAGDGPSTLSISKFGSGSGTVLSPTARINCGSTCSAQFASPTSLTLSATPSAGSTFFGWAGACTGRGTCTVNVNGPTAVTAIFSLPMAVSAGSFHSLALGADGNLRAWGWDAFSTLGVGRQGNSAYPVRVQPVPDARALAAGDAYSVALRTDGTVWGWGQNNKGQLGDGTDIDRPAAVRVRGLSAIVAISAKFAYTLALGSDGTVWAWGDNSAGQLGDGTRVKRLTPVRVAGLSGVVAIQAGYSHSFALKSDGSLWAWGSNSSGQLGDGTVTDRLTPVRVNTSATIVAVAAATRHSAAIRSDGAVLVWGVDAGDGSASDRRIPQAVAGLAGVTSISGGEDYTVLSRSNGTVFAWGREPSGHIDPPIATTALRQVNGLPAARSVEATKSHVFVLAQDGTAWGWGTNLFGELGSGTTAFSEVLTPLRVTGLAGVTRLAAGAGHTQALLSDGSIWAWGYNWVGAFGDGAVSRRSVPAPVVDLAGVSSVVASGVHSVALKEDGTVWTWGFAVSGSLCDTTPTYTTRARPARAEGIADVIAIAADSNPLSGRTVLVKADGTVWECGWDGRSGSATPRQIAGIDEVVAISAGSFFLVALRRDGSVWTWGLSSVAGSSSPTPVSGLSGVVAVAAGSSHVVALRSDGTVLAWGSNFGPTPVAIPGLSDVVAIATTAAVTRDGRVWTFSTGVAEVVPGLADIVAVAGDAHRLAVRRDGVVFSWGFNGSSDGSIGGQLGDGTYITRPNPVVVLREGGAGAIDAGTWFLRLDPVAAILPIPAVNTPKMVAVAQAEMSASSVVLDASAKFRAADTGRNVNVYVLAAVPPSFFDVVKLAPGAKTARELAKAGKTTVLAQLTPAGWSVVIGGQLIPYSQAVGNAAGAATNILNGINLSALQGARFCIGYGENAQSMLTEQTLRDVLELPGASSTSSGLPCLLTGAYVDGPASSVAGTPVTFKASVIGVEPTGTVQFRESPGGLAATVALAASNAAVANALLSTQTLGAGAHSISADYSGDTRNAARSSDIPLRHEVRAAQATARVDLSGPASSVLASPVVFTALVTGDNPTGTVQFRDGSVNLGAPEPIVAGAATLRIATLDLGARSISAAYLGDLRNAPASSTALAHQVFAVLNTEVTLDVVQATVDYGAPIAFTATVRGTNPTGSVVVRDEATVLGTANLVNGAATVTVSNLAGGLHWITATYSGDGVNQTVTSTAVQVAVRAPPVSTPPSPPRLANIATRMQVLTGDNVLIGGFIIGGSTAKTVVVRARGPSLTALGVPGALANPVLNLYSGQTVIASNDDFGASANLATLQASGFAPSHPQEAAILRTLNPGAYTAIVSGAGGSTGVGIIEVFEVDALATPLVNIATRGQVLTGDNVLIGGFIIQGSGPQTVVVRARGPSLTALGVAGALANPVLNLYSGQTVIASNDNWQSAANAAALQSSGFAPADANEAAILITLNPGAYTAIVSGAGGGTGVGMIEVFAVP